MKKSNKILSVVTAMCLSFVIAGGAADAAMLNVTVANTTAREITALYLSASAQSKWGPDQLNGAVVAPGESWTVAGVSCGQSTIVVVAEDEAGCFAYQSVACGSSTTLTLTSATPRDCGR